MAGNSEHVAPASVKINGAALGDADMALVEKIEVRNYRGLPDMASIRMADPEGKRVADPPFKVGQAVEIKLGNLNAAQPAPVFVGEIVAYEPEFTSSAAMLSFRALDKSHRLQRGRKNRTFQKMSASDIVKKLVQENGLQAGTVDTTTATHEFVQQSMESDLDFLNRLAADANREFGVADGKAFLRTDGTANGGATPVAEWRKNVLSFKPRMSATQQPNSVKVTGWDPKAKQQVSATASSPRALSTTGTQARNTATSSFGSSELLIADRVVANAGEANDLAQSTMDRLAGGALEAEGTMQGDPSVQAGGKIQLKGFGAVVRRRAPRLGRHAHLRARQLQDPVHDQRPQPAHADRHDAPEERARLGQRADRRHRHEHERPGQARPRPREVPGAGRQAGERLGADRAARRRARRPAWRSGR